MPHSNMSQHDDRRFAPSPVSQDAASSGRLAPSSAPPGQDSLEALAARYGVPAIDLTQVAILLDDLEILPREIAERHLLLPLSIENERILVAMANPNDRRAVDELEFVTGKQLSPYVAPARLLARVIDAAYQAKQRGARHYMGPNCSSASPSKPLATSESARVRAQSGLSAKRLTNELADDGFGMLSADLSTITDLSVLGRLARAQGEGTAVKATILVVDDEAETRRMLSRALTDKGYRVIEADRGLTALRLVKEQTPSLILLDAVLPEMHGFDIAKRIKGSRKYAHLPIVMMSAVHRGWRYAEDIKASCGAAEYLEKPFRMAEMLDAIERALSLASTGGRMETEDAVSAEAEQALNDGIAAYHAGDLEAAISHLRRGVGIDPLAYRLRFHLGLLLGRRGFVYEALDALETAIGINPRHYPALKNLAVLYEQAGFRNKAIETWERALAVAPDAPTRQSIKDYLMSLL